MILDNRTGAGSMIAADIAAKAQPDGHTLLFVVPAFAINAALQPKLPFDPVYGFTGITHDACALQKRRSGHGGPDRGPDTIDL